MATRDRGRSITPTLESLVRVEHDSFEVFVVDQSVDDASEKAYGDVVGDDPRFRYLRSRTRGKSAACNIALELAHGEIMTFTDDDCVVPTHWLTGIERALTADRRIGMICGGVCAAAHAEDTGAIPTFTPPQAHIHRSPWLKHQASGIGANVAVRTELLRAIGGFDQVLGAGAPLRAGEDFDIVYRVLRHGCAVLDLPQPAVVHYGLRTWGPQLRSLSWDSAMAEGATCMKHLRLGDPAIVPTFLVRGIGCTVHWRNLLLLRRPTGLGRSVAFGRGLLLSFGYRIDRRSRTYADHEIASRSGRRAGRPAPRSARRLLRPVHPADHR